MQNRNLCADHVLQLKTSNWIFQIKDGFHSRVGLKSRKYADGYMWVKGQ